MKKKELTQERLKELVIYDKETGIFTWKERPWLTGKQTTWNIRFYGKEAGYNTHGYISIQLDGIRYPAHRLAWLYEYGVLPKDQIDHIDNIRDHNWISNLREANNSENNQNRKKSHYDNIAGFLGVTFLKYNNKFQARIQINKKNISLGIFNTSEEAHQAYIKAKRELHPYGMI